MRWIRARFRSVIGGQVWWFGTWIGSASPLSDEQFWICWIGFRSVRGEPADSDSRSTQHRKRIDSKLFVRENWLRRFNLSDDSVVFRMRNIKVLMSRDVIGKPLTVFRVTWNESAGCFQSLPIDNPKTCFGILQSTIGRKNQIENGRIEKKITFADLPTCIHIGIDWKSLRWKYCQM